MTPSRIQITQRTSLYLCFLLIMLMTAACSSSNNAHASLNHTTPILKSSSPTSGGNFKTYKGTNFSLNYPRDWKVQGSGNQIIVQDAQGLNALTIVIMPNPGGKKSAKALADATFPAVEKVILTRSQSISLSPTTTMAGETWTQRGATGTLSTGGQSVPGKLILLVANHPATGPTAQAFELYYGGPAATFDQMNRTAFQVMLQSFTFAA